MGPCKAIFSPNHRLKHSLIFVLALATCAALTACVKPYPQDIGPMPVATKLAWSIEAGYSQNPVRFLERHAGEQVSTKGQVMKIRKDGTVLLNDPVNGLPKLTCQFEDHQELASLNRREIVSVSGQIAGVNEDLEVSLNRCRLLQNRTH